MFANVENLGPLVNTESNENGAEISSDGQTLYFHSMRPGGFGGHDMYQAVLIPPAISININDVTVIEGDESIRFIDAFVPAGSGGLNAPNAMIYGPDGNLYVGSQDIVDAVLRYEISIVLRMSFSSL